MSQSSNSDEFQYPQSPLQRSSESVEYPDRVFVGGFPETTSEDALTQFFEKFVQVRETKIHREEGKKGFGFVTLGSEHDANLLKKLSPSKLLFEQHRLNIGPARKKIHSNNVKFTFHAGYTIVTPEGVYRGGTYTFCVDKAPHFLTRSPSKHMINIPSIEPVRLELSGDKSGMRETNNNSHELTSAKSEIMVPVIPFIQYPYVYPRVIQIPVTQEVSSNESTNCTTMNAFPREFFAQFVPNFLASGDNPRVPRSYSSYERYNPHFVRYAQHYDPIMSHQNERYRGYPRQMDEIREPPYGGYPRRKFDHHSYSGKEPKRHRSPQHLDRKNPAKYEKILHDTTEELKEKLDRLLEQDLDIDNTLTS